MTRLGTMKVILLCAEEELDLLAMQILFCLDKINAQVFLIGDGKAKVYKYSRFSGKVVFLNCPNGINDSEEFIHEIYRCVDKYGIDIILPSDIETVRFLSINLGRLPENKVFPVPNLATLNRLDDKWEFYRLLCELNIPTPHTEFILSKDHLSESSPPHPSGPVVAKPVALSGGRGVERLESAADLSRYVGGNFKYNDLPLVVQEWVPGYDMGLAFLANQGQVLAWAVFHKLKNRGLTYRFERDEELLGIAQKIAAHTNYTGVAEIDLRKDERNSQVLVLECNPRFWLSMAVAMRVGLNFVSKGMDLALGKPIGDNCACNPGLYYTPWEIIHRFREKPSSLMQVSHQNLLGILQEKSDVLASLYCSWKRRQQRATQTGG